MVFHHCSCCSFLFSLLSWRLVAVTSEEVVLIWRYIFQLIHSTSLNLLVYLLSSKLIIQRYFNKMAANVRSRTWHSSSGHACRTSVSGHDVSAESGNWMTSYFLGIFWQLYGVDIDLWTRCWKLSAITVFAISKDVMLILCPVCSSFTNDSLL